MKAELTLSANRPTETPETDITTNFGFLKAVFGPFEGEERPVLVYVEGDVEPNSTWKTELRLTSSDACPEKRNWYFTLSTYMPKDGKHRRTKAQFHRAFGVYLDDVGTKAAPLERLQACPPSYIIETSQGNYQAGYLFDEPCSDLKRVEALQEALVAAGMCDPGAKGPSARRRQGVVVCGSVGFMVFFRALIGQRPHIVESACVPLKPSRTEHRGTETRRKKEFSL